MRHNHFICIYLATEPLKPHSMKRFISHNCNLLGLLFCVLSAFSCAKGPGPNDMIKLSQDEIWFGAEGGICAISSNLEVDFEAIYIIDENGNRQTAPYNKRKDFLEIEYDWFKGSISTSDGSCILTFTASQNKGKERKLEVSVGTPIVLKSIAIHQAAAK